MLKTHFKIAWRNLRRDRQFSILNLAGLSTGLACLLMSWLWINDELQVGRNFENGERLFQVFKTVPTEKEIETTGQTPGLLAYTLATEIPEVEYAAAVIPVSSFDKEGILILGEKRFTVAAQFAGKDFFNIFSYHLIAGNKELALETRNSVVISATLARKLFNTTDNIVGKTIQWNQKDYSGSYIITGIFGDIPHTNTERFDLLFSYDLYLDKNPKLRDWGNGDPRTYIRVRAGTNTEKLTKKIAGLIRQKQQGSRAGLFLQNYGDTYLYNHYENGKPSGGRIQYIHLFSLIAVFILIIACINFMNLATAKAARRMKEVGIKKVMGAGRGLLVLQFMSEAVLMSFLSLLAGGILVALFLPSFDLITGKQLATHFNPGFIVVVLSTVLLTGLIAGSYPALYLSGFKPVEVLKGKLMASVREGWLRKGLVLFQFSISALFIVCVLIVYQQMQMIQTKNLGYQRENIIYFDKGGLVTDNTDDFKPGGRYEIELNNFLEKVRAVPGVMAASNFRHNITNRDGGTTDISWDGKDPSQSIDFTDLGTGYEFIETLGIVLKEGRSFSRSFGDEKSKIIFNEAAIETMGLKNPVGKTIHLWGSDRQIIGVVKNFHFQSLHENLKPCFFDLTVGERASKIIVRIDGAHQQEIIRRLSRFYKEYNQGLTLEYRFLDDDYQALYSAEQKVAALSKYFAGFAIIISCLGLFGLSAYTAQKRRKEIGIRKVAGATTGDVVLLLYRDFLMLVGVALLIAFPLAFWLMGHWLDGFAYRIRQSILPYIVSSFFILLMTLLAISFQSIKAALANPAQSLRIE